MRKMPVGCIRHVYIQVRAPCHPIGQRHRSGDVAIGRKIQKILTSCVGVLLSVPDGTCCTQKSVISNGNNQARQWEIVILDQIFKNRNEFVSSDPSIKWIIGQGDAIGWSRNIIKG